MGSSMTIRQIALPVLLFAGSLCVTEQAIAAPGDIYDLGTFGGTQSYGYAINSAGQPVGVATSPDSAFAFRYDGIPGTGGVMQNLGGRFSGAYGINSQGQVVGYVASLQRSRRLNRPRLPLRRHARQRRA